jgi:hypothetical protein
MIRIMDFRGLAMVRARSQEDGVRRPRATEVMQTARPEYIHKHARIPCIIARAAPFPA